jgi:hypothetical protein
MRRLLARLDTADEPDDTWLLLGVIGPGVFVLLDASWVTAGAWAATVVSIWAVRVRRAAAEHLVPEQIGDPR